MKKVLIVVAVLAVAVVAALYFVGSNLGGLVKKGIELAGPRITQAPVTVARVDLSPSSGTGAIHDFVVGNPDGYSAPSAVRLGQVKLEVDPASILSDKIHVKSIVVTDPRITLEGGPTDNNLKKLLANIDAFAAGEKSAPASSDSSKKKLQVDDFLLTGAQVDVKFSLLAGKSLTVSIPDIHLTNLGSGGDGITPGDLSKKVFGAIVEQVIPAVMAQVGKLGDLGKDLGKGAVNNAKGALDKAAGGVGDLFKKK